MQVEQVSPNQFEVVGMGCYFGGHNKSLAEAAGQILHVLMAAYPGHHLNVFGFYSQDKWGNNRSVFHIVHLDFSQRGSNWGMSLHGNKFYSASHMHKEVVTMFGEWLERANLARGKSTGDEIKKVEGVPEKNHADIVPEEKSVLELAEIGMKAIQEGTAPVELVKQQERTGPWRPIG